MRLDNLRGSFFLTPMIFSAALLVAMISDPAVASEDQNFAFLQAYIDYGQRIEGSDVLKWDGEGWIGKDANKLWLKSKGVSAYDGVDEPEVQALYSRYLADFWDLQVGVRRDFEPGRRTYGLLGVQGLAPYFIETSLTTFVSEGENFSARADVRYDTLFTQKLIAQLYFTGNAYAQGINESRVGSGLSDIDTGLRLRYEIFREFAPYLDFNFIRLFGKTADFASDKGWNSSASAVRVGLRFWF